MTANTGDTRHSGLIPGPRRSPGVGNVNPLQYSCLGNIMNRGAWQVQSMGSQRVRHDLVTEQQPLSLRVRTGAGNAGEARVGEEGEAQRVKC